MSCVDKPAACGGLDLLVILGSLTYSLMCSLVLEGKTAFPKPGISTLSLGPSFLFWSKSVLEGGLQDGGLLVSVLRVVPSFAGLFDSLPAGKMSCDSWD